MSHTTGRIVFLVVILAAFLATIPAAQELVAKPKPDDVEALINRLADLDHQDTGYSASTSGTAFLPLGQSETHTIIFGQQRGKHTPLHFAAWQGNADIVRMLLARKADPNAVDSQKRTPLALAKEKGHTTVIKFLER
jgi:hypothetical protein